MSTTGFVPGTWAEPLLTALIESTRRTTDLLYGPNDLRRKGHVETTPYTPAELATRAQALATWQQLTDELLAAGQLDHDSCYECGGELIPVTDTERHEYVWDETEAEHHARTAGMPAHLEPYFAFVKSGINIGRD